MIGKRYLLSGFGRTVINLGKAGEAGATCVLVDVSEWMEKYPNAAVKLFVTPPSPHEPYFADVTIENKVVKWELWEADTTVAGNGSLELLLMDGDRLIKSVTARTTMTSSPSQEKPAGDKPQASSTWWKEALHQIEDAKQAAISEIDGAFGSEVAEGEAALAAAGAAQTKAVEEKGAATLETIPADYTALANDVSSLKDHFEETEETIYIHNQVSTGTWYQGFSSPSNGSNQNDDVTCRTNFIYVDNGYTKVIWPNTYRVRVLAYANSTVSSYLGRTDGFIDYGDFDGNIEKFRGKYIKLNVAYSETGVNITPSDVSGIYIVNDAFTDKTLSIPDKAADAKSTGDAIAALNETVGEITVKSFVKTGSNNATSTFLYPLATGEAVFVKWESSDGTAGLLDLSTRDTTDGENKEKLLSAAKSGTWYKTAPTMDASYLRLSATRSGTITVIKEKTVLGAVNGLDMRTSALESKCAGEPLVRFEFSKKFNDVSAEALAFGLTSETSKTMADVVYRKFHELAESYPGYVTEVLDAETEIDSGLGITLTKPWYMSTIAAGTEHTIQTDTEGGTYTYTTTNDSAAYAVRMYKLIQPVAALGNSGGKRKLFITGGTHGNEVVAPIDLYLLAKMLCEPNGDADLIRLRAAYDIYIIPYLNVFGGRNLMRVNGNLTDINRNFPTSGWTKTNVTDNTFANTALCVFSGVSAGSEYETQLVMALTDTIKPSVFIDHHNSGTGSGQFYTIVANAKMRNVAYQAATDCTVAFVENLPQYFGKNYFTVLSTGGSPYVLSASNGHNGYWMDKERGIKCAGTIEVFESINFLNGDLAEEKVKYTGDAFNVNYFTLKNTLLHFCRYDMEHS